MSETANKTTVFVEKIKERAQIPYKRDEYGWYDLYCALNDGERYFINPLDVVLIPTGIRSAFSEHCRISLGERGSNIKSKLSLWAGKIDSGFRGEWWAGLQNFNSKPVVFDYQLFIDSFNEQTVQNYTLIENDGILVYNLSKAICQFSIDISIPTQIVEHPNVLVFESERGETQLGQSGK